MDELALRDLASLDPAKVEGLTHLKLSNCAPACAAQLPKSLEKLEFWYSEVPSPLRLDLPRLKSLTINPSTTKGKPVAIAELPPGLEKLDLWGCKVERLPSRMPALKELRFDCCDLSEVRWDRLPPSLVDLSAVRCALPEPLPLPDLPALESASFYACNLKDARRLLQQPLLKLVSLGLSPLDDESLAALKASAKAGVNTMRVRQADFDLTRQMYEMGVNLSAEKDGSKKIRLHEPLRAVCQSFPRERVMGLADRVQKGESKLSGQAFIDELCRQGYEEARAIKAAKKAARDAAKAAAKPNPS